MTRASCEAFRALVEAENDRIPEHSALADAPALALLTSTPESARYVLWIPPGEGPFPVVIFLHGFGGLLKAYLNVLTSSAIGRESIILAPALGLEALWWEDAGQAVLATLLADALPPQTDRSRVYLLGLSNGAVGAAAAAVRPDLAQQLEGIGYLSGFGPWIPPSDGRPRYLFLHGQADVRFKKADLADLVATLLSRGLSVSVESIEADHFLILTHPGEWTRRMASWMKSQTVNELAP
jgi:predicted esterase